jgi:hypothetical protein
VQTPPVVKSPSAGPGQAVSSDIYQQDGDYIKDIEINDLRNRYTLTKGAVQKRVNHFCRLSLILQDHAFLVVAAMFALCSIARLPVGLVFATSPRGSRAYLIF